MVKILVTGGAGFIGSAVVRLAVSRGYAVVNLDALTYAGNLDTLASLEGHPGHVFVQGDIGDRALVDRLLAGEGMSEYLGLTLETVSRQISALKKDGVITLEGNRHVSIPDMDRLLEEAGDDSDGGMLV